MLVEVLQHWNSPSLLTGINQVVDVELGDTPFDMLIFNLFSSPDSGLKYISFGLFERDYLYTCSFAGRKILSSECKSESFSTLGKI